MSPAMGTLRVAAGCAHTVLVRSDGVAVAVGADKEGQCRVPPPPSHELFYTGAAAGDRHTVLLRSDGDMI